MLAKLNTYAREILKFKCYIIIPFVDGRRVHSAKIYTDYNHKYSLDRGFLISDLLKTLPGMEYRERGDNQLFITLVPKVL